MSEVDQRETSTTDERGAERPASRDRHPLFLPVVLAGGLIFGFGLAYSRMARPEVVLDFLQLEDFGLLFVMGGAAGGHRRRVRRGDDGPR